jgi:hypothetical protein
MKTPRGLLIGIVLMALATLLRAAPEAAPAKVPQKLLQAKVDAARKTYEVVWQNNKEAFVPFVELAYRWSRRWLEAAVDLSGKKEDQKAAYQAHLDRMRELSRVTHDRYRLRVTTIDEATATEFYTAEAQVWLEQAKLK